MQTSHSAMPCVRSIGRAQRRQMGNGTRHPAGTHDGGGSRGVYMLTQRGLSQNGSGDSLSLSPPLSPLSIYIHIRIYIYQYRANPPTRSCPVPCPHYDQTPARILLLIILKIRVFVPVIIVVVINVVVVPIVSSSLRIPIIAYVSLSFQVALSV